MRKVLHWIMLACLMCLPAASPAHHSFAMFDDKNLVALAGTVKEVQWTNPHTWLQLLVIENSQPVEYSIEGQSPNGLMRLGWKKNTIKAGDKISVVIAPLKDGRKGGALIKVTLPDGRTLATYAEKPPAQ